MASPKAALTRLFEANATFAKTYTAPPPLLKLREMWSRAPTPQGVVVLSCSDPRVIPEKFLGLEGSPSAVIRNAGGRAVDAMRTLLVLNAITPIGLVAVVHHTDCGTTHVHDDEVRASIKKMSNLPDSTLAALEFGEIVDLDESVREDVELIKNDPQFGGRSPEVVGLVYEIETGTLRQVE